MDIISEIGKIGKFQFPSNGKGHLDEGSIGVSYSQVVVSIPFKRERTFRRLRILLSVYDAYPFQFPSNGKGHLDLCIRSSRRA